MSLFELFVKIGVDDQASNKIESITQKLGSGLQTAAKVGAAAVGAAAAGITALTTQAVNSFAEYEQLAGGAGKIFNEIDQTEILNDAQNAYKELGLSANEYLSVINDVGATFAATMGDAAGYEAAKTGLKAISDYASGTGKNVELLSEKFTMITRSTSSYQSIADQFSGILPATSDAFLEQAQAIGAIDEKWKKLTDVPIDEYQNAVSQMLENGVKELGLYNNTMDEAFNTLSGSMAMLRGSWQNLLTGMADDNANLEVLIDNFVESVGAAWANLVPKIQTSIKGISTLITELAPQIADSLPAMLNDVVPVVIEAATTLIDSVVDVIPVLLETLVKALVDNAPVLIEAGIRLLESLIESFSQNADMLADGAVYIVTALTEGALDLLPELLQLGIDLLVGIANGIAENADVLIDAIAECIVQLVDVLSNPDNLMSLVEASAALMLALNKGLIQAIPVLLEAIPILIENLLALLTQETDRLVEVWLLSWSTVPAAIIELFAPLGQWFVDLYEFIKSVFEGVAEWFAEKFAQAYDGIVRAFEKIGEWFGQRWQDVKNALQDVPEWFLQMFTDAYQAVTSAFSQMSEWFGQRWQDVKNALHDVASWFGEMFSNAYQAVTSAFAQMSEWFSQQWESVKSALSDVSSWFGEMFTNAYQAVTNAFSQMGDWFSQQWESVKSALSDVSSWFGEKFQSAYNSITTTFSPLTEWFSQLWSGIQSAASNVVSWFGQQFQNAYNSVTNAFNNIPNFFGNTFQNAKQSIINAFGSIVDWFAQIRDQITGFFSGIVNSVSGAVGGVRQSLGDMSGASVTVVGSYATGLDYVPYDNFVANLHKGEMVVPAEDASIIRKNGIGGSTVNIYQNIYAQKQTAADLMIEARYEAERAVLSGV